MTSWVALLATAPGAPLPSAHIMVSAAAQPTAIDASERKGDAARPKSSQMLVPLDEAAPPPVPASSTALGTPGRGRGTHEETRDGPGAIASVGLRERWCRLLGLLLTFCVCGSKRLVSIPQQHWPPHCPLV